MGVHTEPDRTSLAATHSLELRRAGLALMQKFGFVARYYPPEAVIQRQGESNARTYLVESGWGLVQRDLSNGNRQIIEIPIGGDLVGYFTDRSPRREAFVALTGLQAWEGEASTLPAAFAQASGVADFLYGSIARQRSQLGERLVDIGQRPAAVRVVRFLLQLGIRLEGNGVASRRSYSCPLTQAILADALGLTAIHLNRTLRQMRQEGFLHVRRGHVLFPDYEAAVQFAGLDDSYIVTEE